MEIRAFEPKDRVCCLEIFDSNCPPFFYPDEKYWFELWLTGIEQGTIAYSNSDRDFYWVLEKDGQVIACAGFYLIKNEKIANMAWGMVHRNFHRKTMGTLLLQHRLDFCAKEFPEYGIQMDTSQYTFGFYERFGFQTESITRNGYSKGLDKYVMIKKAEDV